MSRNKTLFIYNTSRSEEQNWHIYSEGVINQRKTVGAARYSATITVSGDVTIQFGVDDSVYLRATYDYENDSWASHTDTPNEFSFEVRNSGVIVSSSFEPDDSSSSSGSNGD